MTERDGFLDLLAILREDEHAWKVARHRTTMRGQAFVDAGCPVPLVAKQLEISVATWYRRRAELAGVLEDEAAEMDATTAALAADDQAAAAAREDVR